MITIIACWLASGIVFGFAALKPVLVSEGVYRYLCSDDEVERRVAVCVDQNSRQVTLSNQHLGEDDNPIPGLIFSSQ